MITAHDTVKLVDDLTKSGMMYLTSGKFRTWAALRDWIVYGEFEPPQQDLYARVWPIGVSFQLHLCL